MKSKEAAEQLRLEFESIVAEDGPWTAHYLELGHGICTLPERSDFEAERAKFALAWAQIYLGKKPQEIRALDIGCLEGGISIWLAKLGCQVVGLEIRDPHLRKARFAARALDLGSVSFVKGDMLRIQEYCLGLFDVIVCGGTLYHVNAPDLIPFAQQLNAMCSGITIFDTHISDVEREVFRSDGIPDIYGRSFVEHLPAGGGDKVSKMWASSENDFAFWPTERSLANLLLSAGYFSISRAVAPRPEWCWVDRDYWIAVSSGLARKRGLNTNGSPSFLQQREWREKNTPAILQGLHSQYANPLTEMLEGTCSNVL